MKTFVLVSATSNKVFSQLLGNAHIGKRSNHEKGQGDKAPSKVQHTISDIRGHNIFWGIME